MIPSYTKRFEKDVKIMQKRGKNMDKLKLIIKKLVNQEPLPAKYRDHKLIGNYLDRRECHIEPDWLLIYKLIPQENLIIFERTGTHSDLFD
jgi:mRNA interferase YafQ